MTEDLKIVNNEAEHRFEIELDGKFAFLEYKLLPGSIYLVHTEVPEEFGGRGIAKQLARHGLTYAREHGLLANPVCPFVTAFVKRSKDEYKDLLSPKSLERVFGTEAN
jgi:predicted GNAT family acetyltransferase